MARVSTHVLDIAKGKPAEGVRIELYFAARLHCSARTNVDGSTDAPLLSGDRLESGEYELIFHAGEYLPQPSFYKDIAIRFQVTDPEASYHVPLLLAPHGYSTYRGS
jgi:5-hydroxyisourate hydrolase